MLTPIPAPQPQIPPPGLGLPPRPRPGSPRAKPPRAPRRPRQILSFPLRSLRLCERCNSFGLQDLRHAHPDSLNHGDRTESGVLLSPRNQVFLRVLRVSAVRDQLSVDRPRCEKGIRDQRSEVSGQLQSTAYSLQPPISCPPFPWRASRENVAFL